MYEKIVERVRRVGDDREREIRRREREREVMIGRRSTAPTFLVFLGSSVFLLLPFCSCSAPSLPLFSFSLFSFLFFFLYIFLMS